MIDEAKLRRMAEAWGPNRDGLSEEQLAAAMVDLLDERRELEKLLSVTQDEREKAYVALAEYHEKHPFCAPAEEAELAKQRDEARARVSELEALLRSLLGKGAYCEGCAAMQHEIRAALGEIDAALGDGK